MLILRQRIFYTMGRTKPLTDFCYRCHDEDANTRENIHILLDEKGEIKKKQCEYCHEEVPDREKDLKLDELKTSNPDGVNLLWLSFEVATL